MVNVWKETIATVSEIGMESCVTSLFVPVAMKTMEIVWSLAFAVVMWVGNATPAKNVSRLETAPMTIIAPAPESARKDQAMVPEMKDQLLQIVINCHTQL